MKCSSPSRTTPAALSYSASATSRYFTARGLNCPAYSSRTPERPGAAGRCALFEAYRDDLVGTGAPGGGHVHDLALALAHQCARNGRGHRDAPGADIRLILADHLVRHPRAVRLVFQLHQRTEYHLAGVGELAGFDNLGVGELVLDILDAALDESLLLARGVILGVLGQVPVPAVLGDRLDDARPAFRLQPLELCAARRCGAQRPGSALPGPYASLCRSCRRFTSTSSR